MAGINEEAQESVDVVDRWQLFDLGNNATPKRSGVQLANETRGVRNQ